MILEDKYLMSRLAGEPEFAVRLHEMVTWRSIGERPVLAVQVRPTVKLELDVHDRGVIERFRVGQEASENWWDGFHSSVRPERVFNGIAGMSSKQDGGWTTELHHDGHMLAAIWDYPTLPMSSGREVLAVPEFYEEFFEQFFAHVQSVVTPAKGQFRATATLLNANLLHFAAKRMGSPLKVVSGPSKLNHLQWPIASAQIDWSEWPALGKAMGQRLHSSFPDI